MQNAKSTFHKFSRTYGLTTSCGLFRPSQNPLDGVLDEYTKYTDEIPPIKEGADKFIQTLSKDYELILFTNRNPMLATKWLIKNNLDNYFKDVTNVKPVATIYIDDRAIQFNGDYNETLKEIENFKVHWIKIN